jgi:threonine synthase
MRFIGTRGTDSKKSFSEVILNPAAPKGGLYVPEKLPRLDLKWLKRFYSAEGESSYHRVVKGILKRFKVDLPEETLDRAIATYLKNFDVDEVVPVQKVGQFFIGELWHGPTRAFKDIALQPFGVLLSELAQQRGENYLILTATSGDTGPATLKSFENRPNTKVVCLYPSEGTSEVQRLQMVTIDAENEKVLGILGNFDDAQTALKGLLKEEGFHRELEESGLKLSAANSVNFGRIIFQIGYHYWSYLKLWEGFEIEEGEEIDVVIPSGNFGNALGAYYAKKMGLPIGRIIIASNRNSVLYELVKFGRYDIRDRKLIKTTSPAMDILKSSNVERLLFDKFGEARTIELMESLEREGYFQLTPAEHQAILADFDADFCTDGEGAEIIKRYGEEYRYILDPHTATGIKAAEKLKGDRKIVVYSTAEWTKFAPTVYYALTGVPVEGVVAEEEERTIPDKDAIAYIETHFGVTAPPQILELFQKPEVNSAVIPKERIREEILKFVRGE